MAPSQDLDIATPERVVLAIPVAGIGYRSIAYLLDLFLILLFWIVAYFVYSLLGPSALDVYQSMSAWAMVFALLGAFATQWLYWTVSEVFWNGQTPGKRLLRIRVVREDGAPAGFFESAVRNLCRVVDFLPALYAAGLLTMLVTRQNRRIGDLLAGTLLTREEKIDLDPYVAGVGPIEALPAPPRAAASPLPPSDVELILAFLARTPTLTQEARKRIGLKMIDCYGAGLSDAERGALVASPEATEAYLRSRAQGST